MDEKLLDIAAIKSYVTVSTIQQTGMAIWDWTGWAYLTFLKERNIVCVESPLKMGDPISILWVLLRDEELQQRTCGSITKCF